MLSPNTKLEFPETFYNRQLAESLDHHEPMPASRALPLGIVKCTTELKTVRFGDETDLGVSPGSTIYLLCDCGQVLSLCICKIWMIIATSQLVLLRGIAEHLHSARLQRYSRELDMGSLSTHYLSHVII